MCTSTGYDKKIQLLYDKKIQLLYDSNISIILLKKNTKLETFKTKTKIGIKLIQMYLKGKANYKFILKLHVICAIRDG